MALLPCVMIQNRVATAILDCMQGKLGEHPLAELIREIAAAGLSGALRLSRERAKVAIYFEEGRLAFATSNLRAHRLREVVKRNGLTDAHVAEFPRKALDEELAAAMIQRGLLRPETLAAIRGNQVCDVLRLALLWTDGAWEFDSRVRLADDIRVQIDVNRLLLECARHLPASFVAARLARANGTYLRAGNNNATNLLPTEAFILSHASAAVTLGELALLSGVGEEDGYRAIYALSLSGLLQGSDWPVALGAEASPVTTKAPRTGRSATVAGEADEIDKVADVEALFVRLLLAKDHYEVLDVARLATSDELKNAYHALARRFHPDRFYQSDAQLRTRVESAFARIAQAYETLSDQPLRADYDARRTTKPAATGGQKSAPVAKGPNGAKQSAPRANANRAETSFQHGMEALKRNRPDEAIRFLAEAAMLSPREARYRAHYGHVLIRQSNTRRIAETELQAALSIEPDNSSYRVMLAELYKQLGLQRRAEGELERALAADPKNEAARSLLLSLKSKSQKS
jgi:curved DNA-binding protein CbpA